MTEADGPGDYDAGKELVGGKRRAMVSQVNRSQRLAGNFERQPAQLQPSSMLPVHSSSSDGSLVLQEIQPKLLADISGYHG